MRHFCTLILSLVLLFICSAAIGQNQELVYENRVYNDWIKSVKFHITGFPLTDPVIDINSGTTLMLNFDDLGGDVRQYTYSLIHCNSDWTPSQLTDMEYLDGFMDQPIRDYRFSFKTIVPFTHYRLEIPNRDMLWKVSGNFLLVVKDGNDLVLTRRFMVVEPLAQIQPRLVRPAMVSLSRTHQEVDFTAILDEQLDIRNPISEVKAVILQNGRWDVAVKDIPPLFVRPRELSFDHQNKIVFPAGKEFRFVDIRSIRSRSETVAAIDRFQDRTEVILYQDLPRANKEYNFLEDINGAFLIETFDQPNPDLAADYAEVIFSLEMTERPDVDIFVVGSMTDWKLMEDYRMVYNPDLGAYMAKPEMKQGYYNFAYAVADYSEDPAKPDMAPIEGDWFATDNQYTVLLYYRPFGSRYDRIIGARTFTSTPR